MSELPFWLGQSEQHLTERADGHKLQSRVSDAFDAMQSDAARDGVDIQIVSSFRGFERQLAIWQQKWLGNRPLFSLDGKRLDTAALSDRDKLHAILTWSALPGGSRHHWGTDLDVYDKATVDKTGHDFALVPEEYNHGGPCFALNSWLSSHAHRYGFYRPYATYSGGVAPEAWHLSYEPLATEIIGQLDINLLRKAIQKAEIGGKDVILLDLPALFSRYTLNGEDL